MQRKEFYKDVDEVEKERRGNDGFWKKYGAIFEEIRDKQPLSKSQQEKIEAWAAESEENRYLLEKIKDEKWLAEELDKIDRIPMAEMWTEINRRLDDLGEPDYDWRKDPDEVARVARQESRRTGRIIGAAIIGLLLLVYIILLFIKL